MGPLASHFPVTAISNISVITDFVISTIQELLHHRSDVPDVSSAYVNDRVTSKVEKTCRLLRWTPTKTLDLDMLLVLPSRVY